MPRQNSSVADVLPASIGAAPKTDRGCAAFHSVLFPEPAAAIAQDPPACFRDLGLDQIVASVTAGRENYDLDPIFHAPLGNAEAIAYRQEIMRELEDAAVMDSLTSFSSRMRAARENLACATKRYHRYEKKRWFLAAAEMYCQAVETLADALSSVDLASAGMQGFGEYLSGYRRSPAFTRLSADVNELTRRLSTATYCLHIHDNSVTVTRFDGEIDYSADVERIFEKFRHGAVKDYRTAFRDAAELNHVEAEVLERVALLYPDVFHALDVFCADHEDFQNARIVAFERDIQFYISYLAHVQKLRNAGLPFCYPKIAGNPEEIYARETFDLALADRLLGENRLVVRNDFELRRPERIFVVTGPNQGGKTTFARTFGQLHYLAALGCPVPGTRAKLFLFDGLFSHFEREEDITNLRGKLQDDLIRIHSILERATPASIVILNEIFSSTTLEDAVYLSQKIMARLSELDLPCVWVTFLDELAGFNEKTASLVSGIDSADPRIRTYKMERRPADGLSYAQAIAEKYGVTYRQLMERIGS